MKALFPAALLVLANAIGTALSFNGFTSLRYVSPNNSQVCFYISQFAQFPYNTDADALNTTHLASLQCQAVGLKLAYFATPDEYNAVLGAAKCSLSSMIGSAYLSINVTSSSYKTGNASANSPCNFMVLDDPATMMSMSSGESCVKLDSTQRPEPMFVCRKESACDVLPCNVFKNNRCQFNMGTMSGTNAKAQCTLMKGSLPLIQAQNDTITGYDFAYFKNATNGSAYWTSLMFRAGAIPINCNGSTNCSRNGITWVTYDPNTPTLALTLQQLNNFSAVTVNGNSSCFIVTPGQISNTSSLANSQHGCDADTAVAICEKDVTTVANGPPDLSYDNLVCPSPAVPNATLLAQAQQQNLPFCQGKTITLECHTGGPWNKFIDDPTNNSTQLQCGTNLQFVLPSVWPMCAAQPTCPKPQTGLDNFNNNWNGTSRVMGTIVTYTCKTSGAKVVSYNDLTSLNANMTQSSWHVKCLNTTMWDTDMNNYTCTPPCRLPVYNRKLFNTTWTAAQPPQIGNNVSFSCNHGFKIVSWAYFNNGTEHQEQASVNMVCQIDGTFAPSLLDYTCTQNCPAPPDLDSTLMKYNWNSTASTVAIGAQITYSCIDPNRQVVQLATGNVTANVISTCKFNGRFSINILDDYGCTECPVPAKPPNGHFSCDSPIFEVGSSCSLICDPGFIISMESQMSCRSDSTWDKTGFACVRPISLVIGGIDDGQNYLSEVEIFAPASVCNGAMMAPLPIATVAPSPGFVLGQAVVCGGAQDRYDGCTNDTQGGVMCNTNTNCIVTLGGTQWCSGPKTDSCLVYDQPSKSWLTSFKLQRPRAYAAQVILPDGRLWILGGISVSSIEASTEIVAYNKTTKAWSVTRGPNMPTARFSHCAVLLPDNKRVLLIGGFDANNYVTTGDIFDLKTQTWDNQAYLVPNSGGRINHGCGTYHVINETRAIVVGGGNHRGGINSTEVFNEDTNVWEKYNASLPIGWKAGILTEYNATPTVAGGVTCQWDSSLGRDRCTRTSSVFSMMSNATGWVAYSNSGVVLSKNKASLALLRVPENFGGCSAK